MSYPYLEEATLIREWIEGDEIVLDNVPMMVERGVGYSLTNTYGRKTQHGEPGPDDHQYNSTNTQRTWMSGQLRRDSQETAETGRYWQGHAWVHTRGGLGHALKVDKVSFPADAPEGQVVPLDRLGRNFFWAVGTDNARIYQHVEASHSAIDPVVAGVSHVVSVVGTVMNRGITFRTPGDDDAVSDVWLYVPTTGGYTRFDVEMNVELAPEDQNWATLGFAINQNKLYRLTTAGKVFSLLDHTDRWQYVATLPDGSYPQNIYRTYDDDGNRCIGVTTSSGQWLLDHDNGWLFDTDLTFPEHAYQGRGACLWRGDDYISVGIGIHRKTGQLVVAAGLDEDDGLPPPFVDGLITDLCPSYNVLVAAVAGEAQGEADVPLGDSIYGLTQSLPYPIPTLSSQSRLLGKNRMGAIFVYNGLGWSEVFTWRRPPTRVVVNMIHKPSVLYPDDPEYDTRYQHMFWGDEDGGGYTVHIPLTYYNPIQSPTLPLDRHSFLEESRIDWNMPDTPKIAKQLNIKARNLWHELTAAQQHHEDPGYRNRIEVVCHWIDLDGHERRSDEEGVTLGPGPYPFSDGVAPLPRLVLEADSAEGNSRRAASIGWERYKNTGVLLPTGLPHEAIWMEYRFIGDPASDFTGAVIEWRTIIARKWMRPNRIYTFSVNAATAVKGMSEEDVLRKLDEICLKTSGVPLVTGTDFLIVDVTRLDGSNEAGLSPRGGRTISCLEFTDVVYEDPIGRAR